MQVCLLIGTESQVNDVPHRPLARYEFFRRQLSLLVLKLFFFTLKSSQKLLKYLWFNGKIAYLLNNEYNLFLLKHLHLGNSEFSLFEKIEILNCFGKLVLRHVLEIEL